MSKFPGAGLVGDMWVAACMSCSTLSVLAIECVSLILTNTHPPLTPLPPLPNPLTLIYTHTYTEQALENFDMLEGSSHVKIFPVAGLLVSDTCV